MKVQIELAELSKAQLASVISSNGINFEVKEKMPKEDLIAGIEEWLKVNSVRKESPFKSQVIEMAKEGKTRREIANELGIKYTQVYTILNTAAEEDEELIVAPSHKGKKVSDITLEVRRLFFEEKLERKEIATRLGIQYYQVLTALNHRKSLDA
jgi:DNA invertase Pin-like site-specific DNA recombinase